MTKRLMIALLSVVVVAAAKPAQQDAAAELKKLRGTWRLVEELDDGKHTPSETEGKTRLTFELTGNWKVEVDGKLVGEGTATFDPTRRPKTVDYVLTRGEDSSARFTAIYELDGDTYRHCGVRTGARPSEFSSKPGSGQILTVFRREKSD